jgi:adenylylsulfate kinase-like enzyme
MKTGNVYWITGLSGAGKTTLGRMVYTQLKKNKPNVVFLDGDILRSVFGNYLGHSMEDRKTLALSYARLCKMLADQCIDVVCATMSLFREVHSFNRKNIANYFEIFIECEMQELIRRDQKGIYSKALRGEMQHVIGMDLHYDRPENCDLVIDNSEMGSLAEKAEKIIRLRGLE